VRSMRFRNCFGIIWSVSTLARSSVATTPVCFENGVILRHLELQMDTEKHRSKSNLRSSAFICGSTPSIPITDAHSGHRETQIKKQSAFICVHLRIYPFNPNHGRTQWTPRNTDQKAICVHLRSSADILLQSQSRTSTKCPAIAAAAAICGLTR
jgi:hypothetical protein